MQRAGGCGEPLSPVMLGHFWTLRSSHTSLNPHSLPAWSPRPLQQRWCVPPCPYIPDTLRNGGTGPAVADAQVARERHREPPAQALVLGVEAVSPG